jgi:hypothetical protein
MSPALKAIDVIDVLSDLFILRGVQEAHRGDADHAGARRPGSQLPRHFVGRAVSVCGMVDGSGFPARCLWAPFLVSRFYGRYLPRIGWNFERTHERKAMRGLVAEVRSDIS